MKTHSMQFQLQRGHTLVVTLCTTAILGIALACYLQLTSSQVQVTVRSQAWNTCIPILEAGIEEALTHCKKSGGTNMNANGWSPKAGSVYNKSGNLGGADYYDVSIFPANPWD